MPANNIQRQEVYQELKELRRENTMQYSAIAEFMGKADARMGANAERLDEHEADINVLRNRTYAWNMANSMVAVIAGALGLSKS